MQMESQLKLPESLQDQLHTYRRRVWWVKLLEAFAGAASGILVGFLLTYVLDRLFDTPAVVRTAIFGVAILTCTMIPLAIDRWVMRRRRFEQLARLLAETRPEVGDQLLGVIELSEDASEQNRSPELVEAAIRQVAKSIDDQDLSTAVPHPRHRRRMVVAAGLTVLVGILWLATTVATRNAWSRYMQPWADTPRYTFAAIEALPEQLVVAHGEPFNLSVKLESDSQWKPAAARVAFSGQSPKEAARTEQEYRFELPGQISQRELFVRVGDYRGWLPVIPMLRPELSEIDVEVQLPKYLGRSKPIHKPIRGSKMSVVRGSGTRLHVKATRNLVSATVNGSPTKPTADKFSTESATLNDARQFVLNWEDEYGLQGQEPLELLIDVVDDESPTLVCENLPRRKILLDSEVISFRVRARDDFGVKRVGIEWKAAGAIASDTTMGERIIAAGHSTAESMELAATFCASDEKIEPQLISFRVFVEDYLPGRERSYGPDCLFEILDPAQHAIWVTEQLRRWHKMSLDVRDREMRLHETNKQLRQLSPEERGQAGNLKRLANQADQERANGRQLAGLVRNGKSLLAEAMRNDEIGVGHLQRWAEMVQVLDEIAENRMPSVADLLKQAAKQAAAANVSERPESPSAGQNRLNQSLNGNSASPPEENNDASKPTPSVSDIESTQHQFDQNQAQDLKDQNSGKQPSAKPRLSLTQTQLAGNGKQEASNEPPPESGPLDDAVDEQEDLLSEFEKVAGDLNDVLANLEGSTLVKRLKASSRHQQQVAASLASLVSNSFGVSDREKEADGKLFAELGDREVRSSQEASNIMDDMSAYFDRSRYMLFKQVLEDMRKEDVTAELRILAEELRKENGLAISQAEYWSDTFDRWAEDLVEVSQSGACPGGKSKDSLPPSIVLEVLQLLEGEVNLREQTRVAEQARPAVSDTEHTETATRLSLAQNEYQARMAKVLKRISDLPEADANFTKEMNLLGQASEVMKETTEILAKPETGVPAIAAETEIIEMLLKSKRFNPQAGGGGGSKPGGGGNGDTEIPALALVGAGLNSDEVREEMSASQSTGTFGPELPEEFRHGLDQYFNQLDEWVQP
ncbi:MAG: hypothetical protein P1U77_21550 [Rubripirellula sp.]|nr:hypothetical protein [Rubripirellula sp.]MDF1844032.1 hypothetical protein [Rubripirellula sp.]